MTVIKRITCESAQQQADQQVVVAVPVVSFRVSTITVMMAMPAAMTAMAAVTIVTVTTTMAAMLAVTVTAIVTVPVSTMVPVAGQRRTGHTE